MSAARAFRRACSSARSTLLGPKIGVLYGLTEAPVTCYLPPRSSPRMPSGAAGSCSRSGACCPAIEVRIDGADASADRSGEVLIRGGNVMAGYWQDEAATGAALRDGWLHTGDIGQFDDGRQSSPSSAG